MSLSPIQQFEDIVVNHPLWMINVIYSWCKHSKELEWACLVAEQVELADCLDQPVSKISDSLERQLDLRMAVAKHPRLIMLDEPAAGLSLLERVVLTGMIKQLLRDVTLVLIGHDMDIVLELADQIAGGNTKLSKE